MIFSNHELKPGCVIALNFLLKDRLSFSVIHSFPLDHCPTNLETHEKHNDRHEVANVKTLGGEQKHFQILV